MKAVSLVADKNTVKDDSGKEPAFSDLIAGIKKLEVDRVNIYRDQVKKEIQRRPDKRLGPDFSDLSFAALSQIGESHFSPELQKKQQRKIRQGLLAVDGSLDLHGCTQQQANQALTQFITEALAEGFSSLVIIHGKGTRSDQNSVLKPMVQHWLARQPQVLAWCPAQPRHGGSGASYVFLRSSRPIDPR